MNHCVNVVCEDCGAIYCIRCSGTESLPNLDNLKDLVLTTILTGENCKYCNGQIYIY